jgi:hypothetical protein
MALIRRYPLLIGSAEEAQVVEPVHEFQLLHVTQSWPAPKYDDPIYDAIKADPPAGCVPEDFGGLFGLRCEREGPTLLDAVAEVCHEVRTRYDLLMTDLGIEKLWEWSPDGRDGFGATIVGQLLLMASSRGQQLGYDIEDLVRFIRTAAAAK